MTEDEINKAIKAARGSFGHIEGRSDIECLCLSIECLRLQSKHRLSLLTPLQRQHNKNIGTVAQG